jgi:thiol:disulfide interchange protein DsbD
MLLALFCLSSGVVAAPGVVETPHVRASLVSDQASIEPGKVFWVALHFNIIEGWHTYWKNPGDSGNPPTIQWTLPAGFEASAIHWLYPERLPVGPLMNYGYSNESWLLVRMTAPDSLPPDAVTLNARADWLVCKEECIPEEGTFSLTLPVAPAGRSRHSEWHSRFLAAQQLIPQPSPWNSSIRVQPDSIELAIRFSSDQAGKIRDAYFYADKYGVAEHAAPQDWSLDDQQLTIRIPRGDLMSQSLDTLTGVVVFTETLPDGAITRAFDISSTPAAAPATQPLWLILAFALLGGLLLNVMPCVFPILSLKALSIVQTAAESPGLAARNGIIFTAGVLISFAMIAGALLILRAGGEAIGWGFQLQSPLFVLVLAWLIFAMGLQFSGVWSFGERWMGIGQDITAKRSSLGSFATGVLAVIVATPCTAPFMGTALGYALSQPAWISMAVFLSLGFGMALPWLLISLWPGLSAILPRPGPWMERVKQVLAFPLYATAAWLVWVLAQQVDQQSLLYAMLSLVLIALALWFWQNARFAGGTWGRSAVAPIVLVLGMMGALLWKLEPSTPAVSTADQAWENYDAGALASYRAEGTPVLINFTAAWCITCLVNEKVVLGTDDIQAALRKQAVVYMKGDWTNRDPAITRVLEQYGRSGVPLYLLFPSNPDGDVTVLPNILTRGILLDALEQI